MFSATPGKWVTKKVRIFKNKKLCFRLSLHFGATLEVGIGKHDWLLPLDFQQCSHCHPVVYYVHLTHYIFEVFWRICYGLVSSLFSSISDVSIGRNIDVVNNVLWHSNLFMVFYECIDFSCYSFFIKFCQVRLAKLKFNIVKSSSISLYLLQLNKSTCIK